MNRRSFLKSVGATIIGLGFLPQTKKCLTVADIRRLRDLLKKNNEPTFNINGEEYYMFGSRDGFVYEDYPPLLYHEDGSIEKIPWQDFYKQL